MAEDGKNKTKVANTTESAGKKRIVNNKEKTA
jgi:hypothetical protein